MLRGEGFRLLALGISGLSSTSMEGAFELAGFRGVLAISVGASPPSASFEDCFSISTDSDNRKRFSSVVAFPGIWAPLELAMLGAPAGKVLV